MSILQFGESNGEIVRGMSGVFADKLPNSVTLTSCALSSVHSALSARINANTLSEWPQAAAMVCFVCFFSIYLQITFQRNISFFFPKSSISSTAETQDR